MLATAPRYYSEQQRLSALAVRRMRRTSTVTEALPLIAAYQATAAELALEHGENALGELDVPDEGKRVLPAAFTVTPGAPSVLEDVNTQLQFDRIVASLVADAGRSAMGAFAASRNVQVGNIRYLTPPSCSRCAILAGRFYRWSSGFQRHPKCDCVMLPGTNDVGLYDPYAAFENGQITDLTKAQTQAIQDGADINQVINARRGMQTVNFAGRRVQITTEGVTSRGIAFDALAQRGGSRTVQNDLAIRNTRTGPALRPVTQQVARAPRLSPEAIYNIADEREDAIRLLRLNGYLI